VFSFSDWSAGQDEKELERLEKRRAAQRRYRESHKEQIKAAARRYRETHREQINAYARRKWRTDPDHREKHRGRNRLAQRRMVFRKVYGISWADYEAMFERQGGACAICKRTGLTLCVDHCHLTGEVRGLLCIRCNSAIGFCSDDPALLQAAAAYLQAARDRQQARNSACAVAGACSGEGGAGSPNRTCATPESMLPVPIPPERDTR
jgi:Autographiviridae endonuclease VII